MEDTNKKLAAVVAAAVALLTALGYTVYEPGYDPGTRSSAQLTLRFVEGDGVLEGVVQATEPGEVGGVLPVWETINDGGTWRCTTNVAKQGQFVRACTYTEEQVSSEYLIWRAQ